MNQIPIFGAVEAVPPRTGLLWLAEVEVYKDPRAGVCFRYRYPEEEGESAGEADDLAAITARFTGPKPDFRLVKADAYLYNLGLTAVPTDLVSEDMDAIFSHALAEIAPLVEEGHYQQFEVMKTGLLNVPPTATEPAWLWTAMRYRQAKGPFSDDDQDRVSHLAVRTDGGYINKVRYTYPAALPASLAYVGLLIFLFEWRHSVGRVLAGKGAIPVLGANDDPEWVRAMTELRSASLPHPLWFFDPAAAEARHAELVADHLQAEADGLEHSLQQHEIRETFLHETAHAIFSILEREMALDIVTGGFGTFVDGRPHPSHDRRSPDGEPRT